MRYTKYQSKTAEGFRVLVAEPIIHPKLGFPIGEKVGFSLLMTEDQVDLALAAIEENEFSYKLVGEANANGYYNVEAVMETEAVLEHA